MEPDMPDWAGLKLNLLVEIALRLPLMEDFTAFRGVCINWRGAGAIKADLFKGVSKVPLLMLSEKDDSDEREFYSLVKKKIFLTMPVPGAKGQRCIGAGFGWILALSSSPDSVGAISLFNPFSSSPKIELPNFQSFPGYEDCYPDPEFLFIRRGMLSANPSVTSNFTVFVVVNGFLGFWRNGDENWTRINVRWAEWGSSCYYKGKMCAITVTDQIYIWDPCGTDPLLTLLWRDSSVLSDHRMPLLESSDGGLPVLVWRYSSVLCDHRMPYLVESSDGELLVIVRNNVTYTDYTNTGVTHFEVMRADLVKMECEKINGLGKDAVFLGDNTAVSVATDEFPGVKPNCIYFTDDSCMPLLDDDEEEHVKGGGKDMGIYNVEDGSIERFGVECFSKICPPLWIFPSF